jgi:hypothetical protein
MFLDYKSEELNAKINLKFNISKKKKTHKTVLQL